MLQAQLMRALGDRYRIERELGRGGMAIVYLAQDLKHRRPVAIKVLRPELTTALGPERFMREIDIAARLSHPNILPLYDSGEIAGTPYYVMPLIEGESLRDRLNREGRLEPDEAIRIARQIADALDYAHLRGLIHRDIKPENVLFQAGHALVSDFGIARPMDAATGVRQMTVTGLAVGTLAYMSPEQAVAQKELDGRTDIYSLGCVLHEMLTGSVPLASRGINASAADRGSALTGNRKISGALGGVVAKALAPMPDDRFATAAEFREALAAATSARLARGAERRRWRFVALAALPVLAALSFWSLRDRLGRTAPEGIRLAVLPFDNLSRDTAQEYFSDGLTDAMITQLGRLHPRGLEVIARTSAMRYKNARKSVREIGRELDVGYVLEGSTLRAADRVRINAQLVRVRDQAPVWSASYERAFASILAVQNEVARSIADTLLIALRPAERARLAEVRAVDPAAYEAYLKGRGHVGKLTRHDLLTALEYFRISLEKDSSFALAHVGIATSWSGLQQMGYVSPREAQPAMRAATARALALDSTLGAARYMVATMKVFSEWDWAGGEKEFRRAVTLDPNNAHGLAVYAHFLSIMRRQREALAHIERALRLDPFDSSVRAFYGAALLQAGRYDDAIAQHREVLATVPNMPIALNGTATALFAKGDYKGALEFQRSRWAARGDTALVAALDRGYSEGGFEQAMRRAAEALSARARSDDAVPLAVAAAYAQAGDVDAALEWLDRSYWSRNPNMPYIGVAPVWNRLRSHSRFQDMLRRMNLPS